MSETKPRLVPVEGGKQWVRTADSFQNFMARVGINTGNMFSGGHYGFNPVTRRRLELEWCHRGSWICGRAVDCIPEDMTREGVKTIGIDRPDALSELRKGMETLCIWPELTDVARWARLYGGAIGWLMIDGQDPATPLRVETIGRGQFKGIKVFDRWMVQPSLQLLVSELGPRLGEPVFYDTITDDNITGLPRMRIHYTRVIRMEGIKLPHWQKITENLWGMSVLERMWDRLISFDSATLGAAQLVYKAHLRTLKVKDYRTILGTNAVAERALVKQVESIRMFQSNEGLSVVDAEDEFDVQQYTFAGIDKVLMMMGEQVSGAVETPLVRLFGQSPAGFSTGETDLANYYDACKNKQEKEMRNGVELIYDVGYRSILGVEPPKQYRHEFNSLHQLTDVEAADVSQKETSAIMQAYDGQVIRRATALRSLKQIETGIFSQITDEEIEEAENDPPPTPEALGLALPEPSPAVSGSPKAGED